MLGHRLDELSNPADRRLVTQLVLGTLAWQGRLDYELARLASRPLDALDRPILAILRMGLYQLRQLTRIPPHAAVDTAVSLARETHARAGASNFVNAILRTALRASSPLPDRAGDELDHLAVVHSHPRWMVERFVEWFGVNEAESIMTANNQAAPNVLRLNLQRGSATELIERLTRDAIAIDSRGFFPETVIASGALPLDSNSFRDGLFTPQSEASQLIARLLAPRPGATVIDCAAAPGGKSTHLAEMVGPKGWVVACDRNLAGLRHARNLAMRLRQDNIRVVQCDSSRSIPIRPKSAEFVLLDAPCSGLGTLREHPEIRWRLASDDFTRMAREQTAMLENAAMLVAPGGILVYAVCSFAPGEGVGVVRDFLARHIEFAIDAHAEPALSPLISADGFLRTRPDHARRDGFFAARLKHMA
jgi:16S rRNA (cytosine967-C5)-methyltransferase